MPEEWDNQEYLLSKTVGYGGVMKALPDVIRHGKKEGNLSEDYFKKLFRQLSCELRNKNLSITKENFQTSNDAMIKLKELIIEALNVIKTGATTNNFI